MPTLEYTIFSPSSKPDSSPLITLPIADLFLGNPMRNSCLVPIPDMLEDDDKASTRLAPRMRTSRIKKKTGLAALILQGFRPSAMDTSDDDMDCNDSEDDLHWSGSEDETDKEMEVFGWMVHSVEHTFV